MLKTLQVLLLVASASLAQSSSPELVVVMSARSALQSLEREQLADIFLGRRAQLPDGRRLVPIDLAENLPQRREFYERFIGMTPVELKMHWSRLIFTGRGQPPRTVRDAAAVKAELAANPDAIGYMQLGEVDATVLVLTIE